MKKSSFKLYVVTFVFTLTLASATFAGNVQCPDDPPPPPANDDDGRIVVVANPGIFDANINMIKDLLGFLIKF